MFAHLHLHTEYSLLDGACKIKPLMERLKALGMTSCAVTDHGVMYGVVDFYRAAKEAGIHPVIGCEVYVCPDMMNKTSTTRDYSHLILLCENQKGYENLSRLVSEGFIRGYYYRPRVDYALLEKHSEGLIALSACLSGDLPKLLLDGRENDARAMARRYLDIFGEGNFFIELQDHGLPDQRAVNPRLVRLARELDIPLVVTNDCHYLTSEDAAAQEVLMCIQTGKTLSDEHRMRMDTDQMYVKSEEEMRKLFPHFDDAIQRTGEIARRCNVEFDFSTTHLPAFPLPEGKTDKGYLRELCEDGLMRKYGPNRQDARDRMEYELGVIESMGYVDYFLIVWDFIHYAKTHGVGVGPGRGSGAGSIVAYALDITEIDPLKYALVFERFLNPERVSMPDIDCDFDYERRGKVIDYVRRRYGADHVAQIITFGTMAARAVIRDVGRVMDMSYQQVDAIAKMVPFELNMTLDKALKMNAELRASYENDEGIHKLIEMARKLEGMPRNASTHAAGVLITAKPVVDYCPLQTNDDVITTQFPMGTVEALGLLKMDFLGLRTLNVIMDTIEMARDRLGADFKSEDIPLDEPGVYKMISDGDTTGIFQLESSGMTQFLTQMKPSNFEDIIAAISLYRPGPMESIPRYVAGKQNPETVQYLTPQLKPILDVTYGCMVYQEQVMQIVRDLAGYSYGRSDLVRRAMAKKKHKVMEDERKTFVHGMTDENGNVTVPGCVRNGVPENVANEIYDEMIAFASYAFNKSHAAAYGVVAMQTAWLKRYYPVQFMAAMLNSVYGNTGKIAGYIQYCRGRDISVLPPNVNRSRWKFTVDTDERGKAAILFGLGAIKSVGENAVAAIIRERENAGPFRDIFDFCRRIDTTDCNKRVTESLIKAGAFDGLGANRPQMLAVYEAAMDANQAQKKKNVSGQVSLFDMFGGGEAKPLFEAELKLPDLPDCPARVKLNMEKDASGVYMTGHPLDDYRETLKKLSFTTAEITEPDEETEGPDMDGVFVDLGGILTEVKEKATKKGDYMAFVTLEDMTGQIECLVFPRVFEKYRNLLNADEAVVISGKISVREDEAPKLLAEKVTRMDEWAMHPSLPRAQDPAMRNVPPKTDAQLAADADRKLFLRLARRDMDRASAILALSAGDVPVYMHIPEEKITLLCPKENWCSGDGECMRRLQDALGAENVVMKQKG